MAIKQKMIPEKKAIPAGFFGVKRECDEVTRITVLAEILNVESVFHSVARSSCEGVLPDFCTGLSDLQIITLLRFSRGAPTAWLEYKARSLKSLIVQVGRARPRQARLHKDQYLVMRVTINPLISIFQEKEQ